MAKDSPLLHGQLGGIHFDRGELFLRNLKIDPEIDTSYISEEKNDNRFCLCIKNKHFDEF
jgi:hypothetical protein